MVGSISALNAVAGAYSQYLPLLVIVGGPNSKDAGCGRIIHHTIGLPNMTQSSQCYEPVVEKVFVVRHLQEAQNFIDEYLLFAPITLMVLSPIEPVLPRILISISSFI